MLLRVTCLVPPKVDVKLNFGGKPTSIRLWYRVGPLGPRPMRRSLPHGALRGLLCFHGPNAVFQLFAKYEEIRAKTAIITAADLTKVGKSGMLVLVMIEVRRDRLRLGLQDPNGAARLRLGQKSAHFCYSRPLRALRSRGLMLGFGHRRCFSGLAWRQRLAQTNGTGCWHASVSKCRPARTR